MKFEGQVALVTGASRGIGKATALKLASEGADVAVHYVNSIEKAQAVVDEIKGMGRNAIPVAANITDRVALAGMVIKVTDTLGSLDLLVNNAGDAQSLDFDEVTEEQWDRMIGINLTGYFNVIWAVKGGMIERKFGRIVNVTSVSALAPRPGLLAYAAAKAGVTSLTKSCCEPLAKHNIRINAVAPGAINTDMAAGISQEFVAQMCAQTPLGRMGEPEEMADIISFLLSDQSSFITGTTTIASGGRVLRP